VEYFYTESEDLVVSDSDLIDLSTNNFDHFTDIAERFATLLPSLRFLQWEFEELYTVIWDVERDGDGRRVVKGCLSFDELDEMVEKEEEGSGGDEEDEAGREDVDV